MDGIYTIAVAIVLLFIFIGLLNWLSKAVKQIVIYEYERGVFFSDGKIQRILPPGRHWYIPFLHTINKMDVRPRYVNIPGQELLSADNIGLKITMAANYKIDDPIKLVTQNANYMEAFYLLLQLQLRDLVGSTNMDDLLAKRKELGTLLFEGVKDAAAELGIGLLSVGIRDITFPGELKNAFAKVVTARQEGLAALEKARGESASLRNLANTAKLLENNPQLMQLRLLQSLNTGSNTIVLQMPDGAQIIPAAPSNKGS
jgi:regulator of protease activity HflC (stomatin/prohibitin superfamily)